MRKLIIVVITCLLIITYYIPIKACKIDNSEKIILIDPGHGGIDGGAKSKSGTIEKDINLQISLKLRDSLKEKGYKVYMTRECDEGLYQKGTTVREKKREDLNKRVEMKKETECDIFISIHQNMFPQSKCYGAQVWYASNDNNYAAMSFFYKIRDFESIMAMDWSKSKFTERLTKNNKTLFMDIVSSTPYEIKKKYINNYIVIIFSLFILNEREYFKREIEFVEDYVKQSDSFEEYNRKELLGEIELIHSLVKFNDLNKMNEKYIKAFEYRGTPTRLFRGVLSLNFGCPSVLSLYHRDEAKLDEEIELIERVMPNYYKITEGNSKVIEALMKAEALFNRGNFQDADILCEKAKYMAKSREQHQVILSALLVQARIASANCKIYIFFAENY